MKWTLQDSGLGFNKHKSEHYTVEPEDLDANDWSAWYGGELLAEGCHGWRHARRVCEAHDSAISRAFPTHQHRGESDE